MSRANLYSLLALVVVALTIAGCGGDDGDSDEDQISETIETVLTAGDPENCTKLETLAFVEQNQFTAGQAAVDTCEENAGENSADSVEVTNIQVDGSSASAEVAISGSAFNGQTIAVSLLKEGDQWKLDRMDEFVEFDQAALAQGLSDRAAADEELPPEFAQCLSQSVTAADPQQIQTAILSADPAQLTAVFPDCFQR